MHFSETLFQANLSDRGCLLGKPASEGDFKGFEESFKVLLHDEFRWLYSACSGLEVPDLWLIRLWPLLEIRRSANKKFKAGSSLFLVGDFMLDSDEIAADLADPFRPVVLVGARRPLAPDFNTFLTGIMTGKLFL